MLMSDYGIGVGEIRVSWTPLDGTGPDGTMDAGAQVRSWAAFIRSTIRFEEDDAS